METRPANDGQLWTREELVLAFELYCRIPFQRTKANAPQVKQLSAILLRTPASVARKLGNFGAFDPQLASRNISGLTHGSKLDKTIWDEFHQDWNTLIILADELRHKFASQEQDHDLISLPSGPSEDFATTRRRLHQSFFRDAVMSSYNNRCCVTGLPLVKCLTAGHIIPWHVDEHRRADPTNGVCMSATFDRLFDAGLITIKEDLTLCVSRHVRDLKDKVSADLIAIHHGQPIIPPTRFSPAPECLRWHRVNVFKNI